MLFRSSMFADTNLERTEQEWAAWNKMGKTQFLYGAANTSPYLQSNIASAWWPFMSFPTRAIQMLGNGVKESWMGKEWMKLARYLALTGFLATAPAVLASTLGVDASAVWGKGALPLDVMPMWYNAMRDTYTAAGGGDSDDYMTKELARRRLWEVLLMMTIPQYRWARKTGAPYEAGLTDIKGAYQRLDDKYTRWGRTESPLTDTNFWSEMAYVFGWPSSDRREGRMWMREAKDIESDYHYTKGKAVRKILDLQREGRHEAANNARKMAENQGIRITGDDLHLAARNREIDAYTLQAKRMPKPLQAEWRRKAEEMRRRQFGTRGMWSGREEEED